MKKQRLINDIILWLYSTNGHPNTEACTKVIISRIIKTLLCNYHDILIEVLIENNLLDIKSNIDISVDDMNLSIRTTVTLKNNGINTLSDLVKTYGYTLLRFKNFGRKSLNEILGVLHDKYNTKLDCLKQTELGCFTCPIRDRCGTTD